MHACLLGVPALLLLLLLVAAVCGPAQVVSLTASCVR
jgi:hypothetical protein